MRRREFIALAGGAAAAWPLAVRAQQPALPVIGFLSVRALSDVSANDAAFHRGLAEHGYIEYQNVAIEHRFVGGQYDRFPALAAEFARRPVTIFVTAGGVQPALAAKAASSTIPIVFLVGDDPVKSGLVASYNRPGGNATGVNMLTTSLEPKRLGLLRDLAPQTGTVGVLVNPNFAATASQLSDIREAAPAVGMQVYELRAGTDDEIEAAFEVVAQNKIGALIVTAEPFFNSRRKKLVTLAARFAVPTIYQFREFAEAGGLASYGVDLPDVYRQLGSYAGRILKGAKPADLPVIRPTKFEFVINMRAAKTLGLSISNAMQLLADEVIE